MSEPVTFGPSRWKLPSIGMGAATPGTSWLFIGTAGGEPIRLKLPGPSTFDYICTSWQDDDPAYWWVVVTDAAGNEIERRRVLEDDDEDTDDE